MRLIGKSVKHWKDKKEVRFVKRRKRFKKNERRNKMNIQQEISSKKEELLADLSALVSIRSVLDETSKGEECTFRKRSEGSF